MGRFLIFGFLILAIPFIFTILYHLFTKIFYKPATHNAIVRRGISKTPSVFINRGCFKIPNYHTFQEVDLQKRTINFVDKLSTFSGKEEDESKRINIEMQFSVMMQNYYIVKIANSSNVYYTSNFNIMNEMRPIIFNTISNCYNNYIRENKDFNIVDITQKVKEELNEVLRDEGFYINALNITIISNKKNVDINNDIRIENDEKNVKDRKIEIGQMRAI